MPRGGIRRTPQLLAKIKQMYEAGASTKEIGLALEVHPSTVIRWLDRAGVPQRPWHRPEVSTSHIAQLRNSGMSWTDISAETGLSKSSARMRYNRWLQDREEFANL